MSHPHTVTHTLILSHSPSHCLTLIPSRSHIHTQDEAIDYYMKNGAFPEEEVSVPKRPYTDIVVLSWLAMVGAPVVLSVLYLAWVGNWIVLGIIVGAVVLGRPHPYTPTLTNYHTHPPTQLTSCSR